MAKAIRFCVKNTMRYGDNVFFVHRPFILGNPYTHIKDKETKARYVTNTREEAIKKYEAYFEKQLKTDENFKAAWDGLFKAYLENDEIYIGCYCSENESCHGDFIIKRLRQRAMKLMVEQRKAELSQQSS